MEWFEYPYPRPDLMNRWSLARHSEVMSEKFESEASKEKFDNEVQRLFKSFRNGKPRADLRSLFECLYAAVKMEKQKDPACTKRSSFTDLYSKGLQSFLENYIHEPPCWKKAPNENDVVLYCMALVVDLSKCVLQSLEMTKDINDPQRIKNAIAILRSLIVAIDKDALFHKLNKHRPLPSWILFHPRQYTKALPATLASSYPNRNCGYMDRNRYVCNDQHNDHDPWLCGCGDCRTYPQESYLWINILLEHFACGSGVLGFEEFLQTLVKVSILKSIRADILQLCEAILQFMRKAMDFLKDENKSPLVKPCLRVLGAISRWHQTGQLDDNSVGTLTLIAQHMRFIFGSLLPHGVAQAMMVKTNKILRDLLLSFQSVETSTASSTHAILEAPEQTQIATIDATTMKAVRDEVSRQMSQQFTKFVSELLGMLVPTLQLGPIKKIKKESEVGEEGNKHCEHCPPSSYAIETSVKKIEESLSALSTPRSCGSLGGSMRNAQEIMSEIKISTNTPPLNFPPTKVKAPKVFIPRLPIPTRPTPSEIQAVSSPATEVDAKAERKTSEVHFSL